MREKERERERGEEREGGREGSREREGGREGGLERERERDYMLCCRSVRVMSKCVPCISFLLSKFECEIIIGNLAATLGIPGGVALSDISMRTELRNSKSDDDDSFFFGDSPLLSGCWLCGWVTATRSSAFRTPPEAFPTFLRRKRVAAIPSQGPMGSI